MRRNPSTKPVPVPVPTPKPGYVPAPPEQRNIVRAALVGQTPAVRAVAAALLPPTPKLMADKLVVQIAKVEQVQAMPAPSPAAAAQKEQVLKSEAAKLAALVESSKVVREPQKAGVVQVVAIDPATAKARSSALAAQTKELAKSEKELRTVATKAPPSTKPALEAQQAILAARLAEAAARQKLLAKGQDVNKPVRVPPAQVSVQREPVKVPLDFKPPGQGEVVVATMVLNAGLKPVPGESPEMRRKKLHALVERFLARKAQREKLYGTSPTLVQEVAAEVLQKDEPIIQAELAETGGLAKDDAAETMSVFVDAAADEIARAAATDAAPAAPPATVDQILEAAKEEVVEDQVAPREQWDDIRDDVVFAETPLPPRPLWQRPSALVAAGAALLALSFATRR